MQRFLRIVGAGSGDLWSTLFVWIIIAGLCLFLANVVAASI